MNYLDYSNYYFIGIGGIGMSSLAEYMLHINKNVEGYDREKSFSSKRLINLGLRIIFSENIKKINLKFTDPKNTLVVFTPAIENNNKILNYFISKKFKVVKRAELLSEIVNSSFCIAIAGTHGKTTTTSILSHILYNSKLKFTSFVGGVIKKYKSNIIKKGNDIFIVEADEYDKTFLKIKPNIASILNVDGDHYDIYNDIDDIQNSFKKFTKNLKKNGIIFHNSNLEFDGISFGKDSKSDVRLINLKNHQNKLIFDIQFKKKLFKNIELNMLGDHNALNAMVAFMIAISLDIEPNCIIKSLKSFPGIMRRFSIELNEPKIFIDDYAHHPNEINSVYNSLKTLYPNKKKLVIFQPHLFSRTKDFMSEFAEALEKFDKIALLDIYPAREKPIEGVTSQSILDKINNTNKVLLNKNDIKDLLSNDDHELVVSMGAGDIGELVESIKKTIIDQNES
jgi:UDP-N-acetylmuramate--alanine ligase